MKWAEYFMHIAETVSLKSKDESTKIGAILVDPKTKHIISTGYNGFPRGVNDYKNDPEIRSRYERPMKYIYTEHAERNAIYAAANYGIKTEGSVLVVNQRFDPCPICTDCARAIIQAGIRYIIAGTKQMKAPTNVKTWYDDVDHSLDMFMEAKIVVEQFCPMRAKLEESPIFYRI